MIDSPFKDGAGRRRRRKGGWDRGAPREKIDNWRLSSERGVGIYPGKKGEGKPPRRPAAIKNYDRRRCKCHGQK